MKKLVEELSNKDTNRFFQKPVDICEVPDYYDIIKTPMDFSTMKRKLRHYKSIDEVEFDFALLIINAKEYNKENTTYYKAAERLWKSGELILKKYSAEIEELSVLPQQLCNKSEGTIVESSNEDNDAHLLKRKKDEINAIESESLTQEIEYSLPNFDLGICRANEEVLDIEANGKLCGEPMETVLISEQENVQLDSLSENSSVTSSQIFPAFHEMQTLDIDAFESAQLANGIDSVSPKGSPLDKEGSTPTSINIDNNGQDDSTIERRHPIHIQDKDPDIYKGRSAQTEYENSSTCGTSERSVALHIQPNAQEVDDHKSQQVQMGTMPSYRCEPWVDPLSSNVSGKVKPCRASYTKEPRSMKLGSPPSPTFSNTKQSPSHHRQFDTRDLIKSTTPTETISITPRAKWISRKRGLHSQQSKSLCTQEDKVLNDDIIGKENINLATNVIKRSRQTNIDNWFISLNDFNSK